MLNEKGRAGDERGLLVSGSSAGELAGLGKGSERQANKRRWYLFPLLRQAAHRTTPIPRGSRARTLDIPRAAVDLDDVSGCRVGGNEMMD